ncbi:PREDICTED: probable 18S rRNA (guanine-N(7))-methyltransferase isoform X1 [Papilio polytes]|uniref:probable 18S rRNA (guanine-N(7))-methyltransferase isoform X1 n=1 Tax=Papilio polytes TaxID=76194 RepID=UPI00067609EF|nr:PREDICTED: probable 18S rRNA (guanine-N(7))-methyltransferase isoform X1 [Papilio polytes]
MSKRPEHQAPPELFYNEDEARKYTQNSRIIDIQAQMTERCIELLVLPEETPCLLLDIGCGSGLSGTVLEENGHLWIGLDISSAMLDVALERETEGDLVLADMGDGVPFKPGSFDGAVSVSALQWLFNADKKSHQPIKRLYNFFSSLYASLSRSARAVFQFYPENESQLELLTSQAMKAGFYGGVVIDYPNSAKAKKFFLVLMTGGSAPLPQALGVDEENSLQVKYARREASKGARGKPLKNTRAWLLEKKERRRKQGKETKPDTKYTGRKRSGRF